MTRSSDKKIASVRKKNDKRFEMEITIGIPSSQKWLGRKNTTLLCVTRRINRAYFNFKHQLHNMTYRLSL